MSIPDDLPTLSQDDIESIEKLTLRWMFQATLDFGMAAHEIFLRSPDDVKDVAEDITRELLDRLPGHNVQQRIFGTVDYKKARYIILPNQAVRQALFIDSKAEKESRTATIQMSQTSMWIKQHRGGAAVSEKGLLPEISEYENKQFLTTTALIHYHYSDDPLGKHHLSKATLVAVPNGLLQDKYNPNPNDTIWRAGRNAPTLGEDFRVRVSFDALAAKANWRIQTINYNEAVSICNGTWKD